MRVFLVARIISLPSVRKMLEAALEWWNKFVALAIEFVTEDITKVWNGGLWTIITDIYSALLPVGYALCMMSFLMGLFRVCSDIIDQKKPEHLIKALIRYVITYSALANGLTIIRTIVQIVQGCVGYVVGVASISGLMYQMPSSVGTAIEDGSTMEQILIFVLSLLMFLLVLFYGFSLLLVVIGRFLRLGIIAATMPIGLGWFGGDLTKDMGRAHLKTYLSTCLEGLVLVIALCISASLVDNFGVEFNDTGQGGRVHQNVYEVSCDSGKGEIYVKVVNSYTEGIYNAGYYDYPSNIYKGQVQTTNVAEADMIKVGNVTYFADNVGDEYTFKFIGRSAAKFYYAFNEFHDFETYASQDSILSGNMAEDGTLMYVLQWMLIMAFNIVLFVNMVKGMDNFTSNLIKGG